MLKIIYVVSMAVAFTYKYDGTLVNFWLKYFIAIGWIVLWLIDLFSKHKSIRGRTMFYIEQYCKPIILIMVWSFFVWIINTPAVFDFSYVSRSISNILCLFLATLSAIAGCYYFKGETIKLSVFAIFISTAANVIRAIQVYGFALFVDFLKTAFIVTDFDSSRPTYDVSQMLEVHDSTLACGFFIIYYLLFHRKKTKMEWLYVVLLAFCTYVGFKRAAFVGIGIVLLFLFLLKKREKYFKIIVTVIGLIMILLSFGYVVAMKLNYIETFANSIGLDFSGRFIIYDSLSNYYSLWPTYIGYGYGYINKLFEDNMELASHSDIVRMYIELGFVPYFLWLYHYMIHVPVRTIDKYGVDVARVITACTVYLFTTYFVGNAMNMFCVQYSFILIPVALSYKNDNSKGRLKSEDSNIINAKGH